MSVIVNRATHFRPAGRRYLMVAGVAALSLLAFVGLAIAGGGPGFPLDDAWIHQTYARNLARSGQWEYVPGVVSAGSTAPLWTMLLALGYLLRLPYLWWAYFLGFLSLLWLAHAATALWRQLWPEQAEADWLVALVLVLAWPLVWAAGSGMETLLFAALGLQLLALFGVAERQRSWLGLGLLAGLLILVRPDGLILLLLLALALGLRRPNGPRPGPPFFFLLAAGLPLLPYFLFNLWSSGHLWPNTFYAKQAEYAALLARPLLLRLGELFFYSLGGPEAGLRGISGAHLLLLPGLLVAGWRALRADWKRRCLWQTLPLLWAGGHIFLYAWRLPVTYQHGRYLWAALPIWIMFGLAGWHFLLAGASAGEGRPPGAGRPLYRVWRRVTILSFSALLLVFLLLGARAYAADVAFIEGEMVEVAHWLQLHTPADALIAAHDIGAIGYFAERPLLDLAGLISPEVVPLLADEAALAAYVQQSGARYLVTAPGWPYHLLRERGAAEEVYRSRHAWTQQHGYNNTAVYRLDGN
jgi:hypothetical protein